MVEDILRKTKFQKSATLECTWKTLKKAISSCTKKCLGDKNANTRSFQLDAQQSFMPHISRMQEDIQMYNDSSNNEKDLDQFGKLLQ